MQVGANIIAMYPSTSLFIAVGQLAIVILVLFSYPLQVHPCRNCLDKVFHAGAHPVPAAVVKPVRGQDDATLVDGSDNADGFDEDEVEEDLDHASTEMSPLKHTLLTFVIVTSGFCIAYFVDDLQMGGPSLLVERSRLTVPWLTQCFLSWARPGRRRFRSYCRGYFIGRFAYFFSVQNYD